MEIAEKRRILPCKGLCLKKDIADNGYCFGEAIDLANGLIRCSEDTDTFGIKEQTKGKTLCFIHISK
jgi:hypothetical protein